MILRTGHANLPLSGIGEDVVADDVFPAVVLMVSAVLGTLNEIVFHDDSSATFVIVEPPPAVGERIDIVDVVVA